MLDELQKELEHFVKERDWEQFHTAKDLAMCLSIETSELLEHFLWREGISHLNRQDKLEAVKDEVGDVMNALVLLCKKLNIDLFECALTKLKKTSQKYPADVCRGSAEKYTEITS